MTLGQVGAGDDPGEFFSEPFALARLGGSPL